MATYRGLRRPTRPRKVARLALSLGAVLLLLGGVAACGEREQRSAQNLCPKYQQLVTRVDELRAGDQRNATAAEIQAKVDAANAQLDALQAASEGNLDSVISTLRTAVADIKQSAVESDVAQTGKELKDTLKSLNEALVPLKTRLATQCPTST
jgi:predicted negative regulator of RcsB-dependent stress response